MSMWNYFFSIPIYRFSQQDFGEKAKELRDKSCVLEHHGPNVTLFDVAYAYSWEMNEIVGWLRLYFHCSQLQVNLVLYKHSRKDWRYGIKKKKFISMDRLTEFFLNSELQGEDLTNYIVERIECAKLSSKTIACYYLDFSEFRQVSNALDWSKVKISSNPEHLKSWKG